MINKFLNQTTFSSTDDFAENYHVNVPDDFNFAYDEIGRAHV